MTLCKVKWCLILGSGFGLYGYLPAAINCGYHVLLPKRYEASFCERKELCHYRNEVSFIAEDEGAIENISICIFAKRPEDQYAYLDKFLVIPSLKKVIVEKPLAPNPAKAWEVYRKLAESGKDIHIGYSFIYTEWGNQIYEIMKQDCKASLHIAWLFMAYHFRHDIENWKRYKECGGGVLRFYGIQLIGILAAADEWRILDSTIYCTKRGEAVCWKATILCGKGCLANICIDTQSEAERFECRLKAENPCIEYSYSDSGPFLEAKTPQDCRVPILERIIDSPKNDITLIKKSIILWELVEENSRNIHVE